MYILQSSRVCNLINTLKYILNIILRCNKYFECCVVLYMPFIITVYLTQKVLKSCKRT